MKGFFLLCFAAFIAITLFFGCVEQSSQEKISPEPSASSPATVPLVSNPAPQSSPQAINAGAKLGNTDLLKASESGDIETVRSALEDGVDINAKNTENQFQLGMTPLMYASARRHSDITALLVEKGADINAKDNDGSTALMYAAFSGDQQTVELLLSKGANTDHVDAEGLNAVGYAKQGGYNEIADLISKSSH